MFSPQYHDHMIYNLLLRHEEWGLAAGERLLAGSHQRSSRSGVRAEGRAVVGGHQTEVRELGEGQIRRNRELAVRVFDAAQIVLGRSHLRVAHAVADEHEHVLRLVLLNKMYSTGGM